MRQTATNGPKTTDPHEIDLLLDAAKEGDTAR